MRSTTLALVLASFLISSSAEAQVKVAGGGATPQDAYNRLQRASETRDLVELAASLEPEHRALLLRDFFVLAMMYHSGLVEGVTPDPAASTAVHGVVTGILNPAVDANPLDPAMIAHLDEDAKAVVAIGWAISKLPLIDALRVARVTVDALSKVQHPSIAQTFDAFATQVPKGEVSISKKTDRAAWAEADGRPLGFTKHDGRWFVGGVWFDRKTITLSSEQSPQAGVSPNVIIAGKPAQTAGGSAVTLPEGPPMTALEAYAMLKGAVALQHPDAQLRELQSGIYPIDAHGKAGAWFAHFLTSKPGEVVSVAYIGGSVLAPSVGAIDESAKGLADLDKVTFDTLALTQLARDAGAKSKLAEGTKMTAALVRSSVTGNAEWIFHTYGEDERIAWSVIIDAKSATVTHVSK